MASRAQAEAVVQQLIDMLERRKPRHRGLLGSSEGTIEVSSKPGYVYFREDGNPSKLRQIFNKEVPILADLPVIVGEDSNNPGIEQVLDVDIGVLPNWMGRTFLPTHHLTHELGGQDTYGNRVDSDVVFVQKAQFLPLSLQLHDPADMSLYVNEDWYLFGDTQRYWPGEDTKTFSAPVTDGRAAYELVCIHGGTNTLIYVRGVDFPIAAGVDETLIPDAPIDCVAVGAVLLTHGDTYLNVDNIADGRIFFHTRGGTISGSPHAHTSPIDGGWLTDGLTITGNVIIKDGGLSIGVESIDDGDSPYLISDTGILLCDTILGDITVNLPVAATQEGLMYNIKNISTGEVVVDADGAETIDLETTQIVNYLDSMKIASDGVGSWWII